MFLPRPLNEQIVTFVQVPVPERQSPLIHITIIIHSSIHSFINSFIHSLCHVTFVHALLADCAKQI